MLGVVGVDPHAMIIFVDTHHARAPRTPAVVGEGEVDGHAIHPIGILRIDANLREVERAIVHGTHPRPRRATVRRAVQPTEQALRLGTAHAVGFDHGVHHVGIAGRDREIDAPLGGGREPTAGDLFPRRAAVGGLPERRTGAATLEEMRLADALPAGGIQHVRIARIHREIHEARLVADELGERPGFAAVDGLIQAALGVGGPQCAQRGDVHDVGVGGMHENAPDVLRFLEAHALPCHAAIERLVDAVARSDGVA